MLVERHAYGPLLLVTDGQALPSRSQDYLLDIQPGYERTRSAASTTTAG